MLAFACMDFLMEAIMVAKRSDFYIVREALAAAKVGLE